MQRGIVDFTGDNNFSGSVSFWITLTVMVDST
jgi:hypothetical protein